ncbi:MAG: hypothetical protein ABSH53_24535 [Holophaga sp.]
MRPLPILITALISLPVSAQAWDLRAEVPFLSAQGLPQTTLGGGQTVSGSLGTGHGLILTASHRIIRVGPVLKFEWNAEYSQWQADGTLQQGAAGTGSTLKQNGLGLGANAQFWMPFTGFAGEAGLLERFQSYRYEGGSAAQDKDLARPWLRLGLRWVLPFPGIGPYLAASYQVPLTKDKPVSVASAADLDSYLSAQGSGQEFQHLWTLGVGISF